MKIWMFRFLMSFFPLIFLISLPAQAMEPTGPTRCNLLAGNLDELLAEEKLSFLGTRVENVRFKNSDFYATDPTSVPSGAAMIFGTINGKEKALGWITYKVHGVRQKYLQIDTMNVLSELWGQSLGTYLLAKAYRESSRVFSIQAIAGTLNSSNAAAFITARNQGMKLEKAWKETPAYKIRKKLGFGKVRLERSDETSRFLWVERGEN